MKSNLSRLEELPAPLRSRTGWPWDEAPDLTPNTMPQGTPWPTFAIVTPSYQQGEFLEASIRSVLLQGYPSLEYVVLDGGSDDGSREILERYAPWLTQWRSEPDEGQAAAINDGFAMTQGKIMGWLNSDDRYCPGALTSVALAFQQVETLQDSSKDHPVGAILGRGRKVDSVGVLTHEPPRFQPTLETLLDWSLEYHFMQPSCFFSRAAWERSGPLDPSLRYCLDVDLWIRIARHFRFQTIPQLLSEATAHPGAKTTAEKERTRLETALLKIRHGAVAAGERDLRQMADRLANLEREHRRRRRNPFLRILGKG